MSTVINIPKNASFVVDFISVGITADRSLKYIENDGWFLLKEVDRTPRDQSGRIGAIGTDLKGEDPATLPERRHFVEEPCFDRSLLDRAQQSDTIRGKL